MNRKKKKLKLSPAMKLGMMLILLEGNKLVYANYVNKGKWYMNSPYPAIDKDLSNDCKIPAQISTCTISALERRGLARGNHRRFISSHNIHTAEGIYLTKQGLHRIKQWPEYGEIIAMKVIHDL